MKRTATIFLFAVAALTMSAQEQGTDRNGRAGERIERMAREQAKQLQLTGDDATWFTNLFVEYQTELRKVRQAAMKDMPHPKKGKKKDDAMNGEEPQLKDKEMKKLTDEEADKLILAGFDRTEKELAVKRAFYPRFREKIPANKLLRLFVNNNLQRAGQRGGRHEGRPGGRPGDFGPGGGFPQGPMRDGGDF